jgi:small subunit ribosomal protein S4e
MHQARQSVTTKIPIERKGTKYIVRASSHIDNSVPLLIAVRDILGLAKTAREVKHMIQTKLLKINGRLVEDFKESIKLFNILEADKVYVLSLLPTKKFVFEETKDLDTRLVKVVNKRLVPNNFSQLNLHDGSNVLTKDKINVGDSLILDFSGKIKKHIQMDKGREVFVISGKYAGHKGKIESVSDSNLTIKFKDKEEPATLNKSQVIVR